MKLKDRTEAGQLLANKLLRYANNSNVIVLGLPRGGVPVAYEIANQLNAPLDIFLVRKLGVPWNEELAFGAIAMGNVQVFNEEILQGLRVSQVEIDAVITEQQHELKRRNQLYRQGRPLPDLQNKIVIIVDDGLATGATMRAAISAIQQSHPQKIIVAVPVAPIDTVHDLEKLVKEVICLYTPEPFYSIGQWYENFPQTSDTEVIELLNMAKQ